MKRKPKLSKRDQDALFFGRMLMDSVERQWEEYVEKMKRSCPLCSKEKHGGWPCD